MSMIRIFVGFFEPCDYLKACARKGTKLSAGIGAASKL